MILAPSTVAIGRGYSPSIILNDQAEYTLVGIYDSIAEALAVAIDAIEAIRADQRAALPQGWEW